LPVLIATLWLLALAPQALAGPPSHARDEGRDLAGFDHACGTAVDSDGNVYVASAGEDKIKIFNSAQAEIDSIPNANDPCGLAVDTHGTLFVSERATKEVVRYLPPTYTTREVIDSSGDVQGVSVDATVILTNQNIPTGGDDSLFIAKSNQIDGYRNEKQRLEFFCSGGTYTLEFESQETPPLNCTASHEAVQDALEALSTVGDGNVHVTTGNANDTDHLVTFVGSLGLTNVPSLIVDQSSLTGFVIQTKTDGGSVGPLAQDPTANYTGVAAYTHEAQGDTFTHYLFVADANGEQIEVFSGADVTNLEHRRTVTGVDADEDGEVSTGEEFQFGAAGTALAADPGNRVGAACPYGTAAQQACTAGHFLLYDGGADEIVELEATGEFVDRIEDPGLVDAEPTGLAIDRSGEASDGTIYASVGPGPGAKVLAFEPLVTPDRAPLPGLSQRLTGAPAAAVETDGFGNTYVAAGAFVHIFGPDGQSVTKFEDSRAAFDLAVDSKCNVYVLDGPVADRQMTYYSAKSCPPTPTTTYTRHAPSLVPSQLGRLGGIAINPANDHPFLLWTEHTRVISEFAAADEGSVLVGECGGDLGPSAGLAAYRLHIDVYGANSHVYIGTSSPEWIYEIDCGAAGTMADDRIVTQFKGTGCPNGQFGSGPAIAVDQSNGHVVEFVPSQATQGAREYEASGSCVAQFGASHFSEAAGAPSYSVAIDNSGGPTDGVVYVAYDSNDDVAQPFDLNAFAPLSYGETPAVTVGAPSGLGDAEATFNGTVNPNGFALGECRFEYLTDAEQMANVQAEDPPFQGATPVPCDPSAGEIEPVGEAVPVTAEIAGLDPEVRYRYRLLAENEFGSNAAEGLFGPPLLTPKPALPVLYDEATLRGDVDPSGLITAYSFEYATDAYFEANGETYEHKTPALELAPGEGAVAVKRALTGLVEGTGYHFRLLAENEALAVAGPDQTFHTREQTDLREDCPNAPYRTGLSAKLPDCRAYELATPPNTGGAGLFAGSSNSLDGYLAAPRGPEAGQSVGFFSRILPGLEGTGETDGYRSHRAPGEHPEAGWSTELAGPTYEQLGAAPGDQKKGVGSDQRYWLWDVRPQEFFPSTLAEGLNLRTPPGVADPACAGASVLNPQPEFELAGCASLGTDPEAVGLYLGNGDDRVIFSSKAALEPTAPPAGTAAIYSRLAGEASAEVLSLPPSGASQAIEEEFEEEDAHFLAVSGDGSTVAFEVAGTLYLRRGAETIPVSEGPHGFAGLSDDGTRVFYTATTLPNGPPPPAQLFLCDVEAGPCVGGGEAGLEAIAPGDDAVFVNVADQGEDVLFTSEEEIGGVEPNENGEEALGGEPNLYHWDGGIVRFVAILDPGDLAPAAFGETSEEHLRSWAAAASGKIGGAIPPTRAAPGGQAFLFLSHAQLTGYENTELTATACGAPKVAGEHCGEVFRYAPGDPPGSRLLCLSCDPTGAPPSGEALLQDFFGGTSDTSLIDNITADGASAFFETPDPIVPEDANDFTDVYEWKALGAGEGSERCEDAAGCLSLISSGQGEAPSNLYGMTDDGSDVFFRTADKLVGSDASGSSSIYDARVGGGIPDPPVPAPCQGDACQPLGAPPPSLPAPPTTAAVPDGDVRPAKKGGKHCPKGKRKVKSKGKVRCVNGTAKGKKQGRHRDTGRARGTQR